MVQFMLFLHGLGAVAIGFYLLLPFIAVKLENVTGEARHGFARSLVTSNRIAQWVLIIQFLIGGYLISGTGGGYSVAWMAVAVILLVVIGAMGGMIGAPLRRIINGDSDTASRDIGRIRTFSTIAFAALIAELVLMYYPTLF